MAILRQRWEQVALEVLAAVGLFMYSRRPLAKIVRSAVLTTIVVAGAATLYRVVLR